MKQTEIGMIPDDWEVKRLGEIAFVTKLAGFEFTAHVKYSDQGKIIALRGLNVRQGFLELKDVKYIDNSNFSELNRSKLYKNDLLFTYVGTVGNVALVDKNDSYYLAPNVALIRNTRQTDSQYIMYLLLSTNFFNSQIKTLMSTTSQAALSMTNIRLFKIPFPPTLAEQQKIAKALSDVDNVISTLEKLITKKKNLKQGTIQQLLTGKKRLPGFAKSDKFKQTEIGEIPEDWEVVQLNTLIDDISDGPFGSNLKTEHYTTEREARIIQLSNVGEDGWNDENTKYTTFIHAKELSRCIVPSGSVIIAKMMPAGRSILCPNNERMYILGSDCVKFIPNKLIDSKYFVYYTKCTTYLNQIKENTQGSTRARTSVTKLRKIEVVLPSKPEQTSIANVLSSMDKEIEALEAKLEKYRDLKTGMMQQLLTGKIRLR